VWPAGANSTRRGAGWRRSRLRTGVDLASVLEQVASAAKVVAEGSLDLPSLRI